MFTSLNGTLINIVTVLVGGLAGTLIGNRLAARYHQIIMQAVGLSTLAIGLQMALSTHNVLYMLGGITLGGLVGEWLGIDAALERLGDTLQARVGGSTFSEAFVTSSLVFCVGPLTFLGAIKNGLSGDYHLLALKSLLDLFSSFAFGASLGWGVLASVGTIAIYQGSLSLGASLFRALIDTMMIAEMTAVGGLIVLGVGLKLLHLVELRLGNFLPALLISPLLAALGRHVLHV
ncbi:MAG: DUF554 domain-containing protein [Chloroflexota bacterium]